LFDCRYESPPGIKQNLLRTFESWDAAYFSSGSITRAQILFVLAWFHAVVQERRTYIPQGFTKFYEFSFADLRSGADIIDAACARITDKASNLNTGGSTLLLVVRVPAADVFMSILFALFVCLLFCAF
jgi:hypothetical protein